MFAELVIKHWGAQPTIAIVVSTKNGVALFRGTKYWQHRDANQLRPATV